MKTAEVFLVFFFSGWATGAWMDYNCPAPRSPENGLGFIFANGRLVHFRCHPGYLMKGKQRTHCVNGQWTVPTPECHKDSRSEKDPGSLSLQMRIDKAAYYRHKRKSLLHHDKSFNDQHMAYGDGPRRVPLINGIWPDKKAQIMSLGPRNTPGPQHLVQKELDIAELRQRQYEEVARDRYLKTLEKKRKREIAVGKKVEGAAILKVRRNRWRNKLPKRNKNKKWTQSASSSNVAERVSRVDASAGLEKYSQHRERSEGLEFRRARVESVHGPNGGEPSKENEARYDASCVEPYEGRELPLMAPRAANAFVYRYETKKGRNYPFGPYMAVRYKCLHGYVFEADSSRALYCRRGRWEGPVPSCIRKSSS